jgi:hypothetical protein
MGKYFVAVITVLTLSVFITGCSSAPPPSLVQSKTAGAEMEPNKPTIVEPQPVAVAEPNEQVSSIEHRLSAEASAKAEAPSIEPNEVKPIEAVPEVPAPIKPEPNDLLAAKIEPRPVGVEPPKAEPNALEPNVPAPVEPEPNVPLPIEPKLRQIEPNRPVSSVEPNEVKHQPTVSFHDKCDDILKNYVNDKGMVNYKALRYKRLEIKNLLDEFANLNPNEYSRWPKEDKIAFWINAYNIQMLKVIIDNYPIQGSRWLNPFYGPNSIRHIKGIWSDYKFIVMDEEFTLAEVDRRFFSKEFDEPRIFFAISLASISSPPLRNEPYYGHKLNQQLEDQTKKFLSNPLSFRIDRENKKVYLSAILQPSWRGKEFMSKFAIDRKFKDQEPETRAVLNFITKYLTRQDVDFLEVENYSIKYIKYDWTLNDGS